MVDLGVSIPASYATWQLITNEEALNKARDYLDFLRIRNSSITLAAHGQFLAVHHFEGEEHPTNRQVSGWLVGGSIPYLHLSDHEIQTPVEALAVYALSERTWLKAKGLESEDGSVPVYRIPPTWEPLTFSPGFEDWRLGAVTSFIAWHILPKNSQHLIHQDISQSCQARGWIRR